MLVTRKIRTQTRRNFGLGSPATVVPALAFIAAWQSGTCMLIFLAGLKGIPRAYYEASEVDGANARQRLWRSNDQNLWMALGQVT